MSKLEIIQEGKVVASSEVDSPTRKLSLNETDPGSMATLGWPREPGGRVTTRDTVTTTFGSAASSRTPRPVYVSVGGPWGMFDMATAKYMLTLMHGSLTYIDNSSRQHSHGHVTHHHGEDDHIGYLKRPINEAIDAVHRRMHEHGFSH